MLATRAALPKNGWSAGARTNRLQVLVVAHLFNYPVHLEGESIAPSVGGTQEGLRIPKTGKFLGRNSMERWQQSFHWTPFKFRLFL